MHIDSVVIRFPRRASRTPPIFLAFPSRCGAPGPTKGLREKERGSEFRAIKQKLDSEARGFKGRGVKVNCADGRRSGTSRDNARSG